MKSQCDVCNENEAVVYCSADEAALCFACDHRVHHANKLADRAILCKDCDVGIHKVNQHTRDHSRFLLTGVKLSPTASLYSSSTTKNGVVCGQQEKPLASPIMKKAGVQTPSRHQESNGLGHGSSTSSISEYLIETLPGWHVKDFLDPPPSFFKVGDNDPWPVWGEDLLDGSFNSSFEPESMGIWVPQAPPVEPQPRYANVLPQFEPGSNTGFGDQIINRSSLSFAQNKITKGPKSSRNWTSNNGNCFTVPQISPSSTTSKRSRTLWH